MQIGGYDLDSVDISYEYTTSIVKSYFCVSAVSDKMQCPRCCDRAISLRKQTYLTYTMDLHPVGEVLAFSSLSLPEKTFYLCTVRCLLQANPTKICHFHISAH